MKKSWYIRIGLVLGFNLLIPGAQAAPELARSADTITYYIIGPQDHNAGFTWTISGGTMVGHSSPYTAADADTIKVIWDDTEKTAANYGSLSVYKTMEWEGGSFCLSENETIDVESWVQPKAVTDTSGMVVCSGESFTIRIDFEGKSDYRYKWKLYDKDDPSVVIEDYTGGFIVSSYPSATLVIDGIENNGTTVKTYEFNITDVQDGLPDGMPGDVTLGRASIHVQPKAKAGTLESSDQLIRR